MTVSGVISSTNFDVTSVIDAAYRRCRLPAQRITSEMQSIALTALNLTLAASPGKGLQLWATDSVELTMTAGVAALSTPAGTIDILSANLKTNGIEIPLTRISQDIYDATPNKIATGRPVQYWLDRQRDVPLMMLWRAPDAITASGSTIIIRRQRQIMDVTSLTQTLDIPQRWHDAIISDLAWRIADETPAIDPSLGDKLKTRADEAWKRMQTAEEDKSPLRIIPRISGYTK